MTDVSRNTPMDHSSFEALFKQHFAHLCNFSKQYVQDENTAKDIVQKVFIKLWESRAQIDLNQNIQSYLFTSVKNRSLNYIRDNQKYRSRVLDLDCGEIDLMAETDQSGVQELQAKISQALASLPEKCRLVFEMSRFKEMKYREIAEELDISQKTVEAHMSKAMKTLRVELKDHLYALAVLIGWII